MAPYHLQDNRTDNSSHYHERSFLKEFVGNFIEERSPKFVAIALVDEFLFEDPAFCLFNVPFEKVQALLEDRLRENRNYGGPGIEFCSAPFTQAIPGDNVKPPEYPRIYLMVETDPKQKKVSKSFYDIIRGFPDIELYRSWMKQNRKLDPDMHTFLKEQSQREKGSRMFMLYCEIRMLSRKEIFTLLDYLPPLWVPKTR